MSLRVSSLVLVAVVAVACSAAPRSPTTSGLSASASASVEASEPSAPTSAAATESAAPAPTGSPAQEIGALLRVTAAGVRMRSEPSASATLLATLPAGATVSPIGSPAVEAEALAWYEVRFAGTTGWVTSGPDGDWLAGVANGRIGFGCIRCGDGDSRAAVTVKPDGSDRQLLLSAFGGPTWSPDGTRVVIEHEAAGSFSSALTVMAADGSNTASLGEGSGPAWSPDGEWLAFSNHERGTLVIIDPDGRRFDLTVNDFGAPGSLAWAPDSSRLAFVATDCDECPTDEPIMGDIPNGIFLFTPPMGEVERVVERGYYGQLTWSPDGRSLTYLSTDLSVGGTDVRRLDVAGGTVTVLLSDSQLLSGWAVSPDGTRIVALREDGVIVADAEGQDSRVIMPRTNEMNPTPSAPRWSPDGQWILFDMLWVTGDAVESWIVRADGSGTPQRVSEDAYEASWQPVLARLAD